MKQTKALRKRFSCVIMTLLIAAFHLPKFERRGEDIIFADDRYLFFTNINDHLERLMGITARDYRVCDHYAFSSKARDMLAAMRWDY